MRLTTIILIMAIMQVSASTFAQRITLSEKNVTMRKVFDHISDQCGYDFVFNSDLLKATKPVTISVKNTELEKVLEQIFAGQPLSFSIEDKTVVVKAKQRGFLENMLDNIRAIDVRGKVLDEKGEPLVGATVAIKGKNRSVKTDQNGGFFLENVGESDKLVISFIGYQKREVDAASDMGSLTMVVADQGLEEVKINAGYYSVTEREKTGSISRITSKEIGKQPVTNVLQAMQATVPGVEVIQTTGLPGGGFSVFVRGRNSITPNRSDPFYIIDGVPFISIGIPGSRDYNTTMGANPLASLNPSDIETIEILKDADATAIYGSRAANGVVLITTKRGKSGKPTGSFSYSHGISRVGKKLDLMNTEEYVSMRKEALANDNKMMSASDLDLNGTWDLNKYTDWQKELIGKNAPTSNLRATLSGGGASVTYLISGNHYNEGTVFPGESSYKRTSGNFSLQYKSTDNKLDVSFDSNYSLINSNLFTADLTTYIRLVPNYPDLLDQDGRLNWDYDSNGLARRYLNPVAESQRPYNSKTDNLISNFMIKYSVVPELMIKANLGYTKMGRNEFASDPLSTYSPLYNYGPSNRYSYFTNNSNNSWILEGQADWNKNLGPGKFSALLGTTIQENLREAQEIRGSGFNSDVLLENIAAASQLTTSIQGYLKYRYTGVFGRINYNVDNKYIINATGRRDGSSRFGADNRFANFGALGIAWIASEEGFVKRNLPFLSLAKLRGSFGITGSDIIPDYGYLELWDSSAPYQNEATLNPSGLANPEYGWEVNKKTEIALEMGIWKDRIFFSGGFYDNTSSNQLLSRQLPPSTGFVGIQDNINAKVKNSGFEFSLNSKNIITTNFNWTTNINLTIPSNKLVSYPNFATSGDASLYAIGYPLNIKKLLSTDVNPQTGFYEIKDYDGNGTIEFDKDNYIIQFIGRKYFGGINNSISFKGLQMEFLFQFVKQTGSSAMRGYESPGSFSSFAPLGNQTSKMDDRWRSLGDNSQYQKFSTDFPAFLGNLYGKYYGTQSVEDASFVRLKNLSISYNLNPGFLKRLSLSSTKIFIQGQNLFTTTRYQGLDPETLSSFNLPSLQVFTAGIQITI